mmetsp:Transcript_14830/g.34825  ORF Transcript_14830/g.34825 Transcript_14830/m.34825 type:complete len:220 (-) Transcript_14830:1201-1860(-)
MSLPSALSVWRPETKPLPMRTPSSVASSRRRVRSASRFTTASTDSVLRSSRAASLVLRSSEEMACCVRRSARLPVLAVRARRFSMFSTCFLTLPVVLSLELMSCLARCSSRLSLAACSSRASLSRMDCTPRLLAAFSSISWRRWAAMPLIFFCISACSNLRRFSRSRRAMRLFSARCSSSMRMRRSTAFLSFSASSPSLVKRLRSASLRIVLVMRDSSF